MNRRIIHANCEFHHVIVNLIHYCRLISNPVKFAEIAGETTVVIRIKNSDGNVQESKENKVRN